jgi:transposase InsO family protein
MLASTMRLALETTIERRRNRASQCRCRAWSRSIPCAETVIGLFKTEVIRRSGPWRSMEAVEVATLEWVDWFNHRRLLEPIGNMPPAEAEARCHIELEAPALAA